MKMESCASIKKSTSEQLRILYTLLYCLILVICILGYVVVLPSAFKKKRSNTNFIGSLAFADWYMVLVLIPMRISEVYGFSWLQNGRNCLLLMTLTTYSFSVSCYMMVVVSIDRLLFFSRPFKYKTIMTSKISTLLCSSFYIVSLVTVIPLSGVGSKNLEGYSDKDFCEFHNVYTKTYTMSSTLLYFLLPFLLAIILQIRILYLTKQSSQKHREHIVQITCSSRMKTLVSSSLKREMRIHRIFFLISIMFSVSCAPSISVTLVTTIFPEGVYLDRTYYDVARIIYFLNGVVNPWIMIATNPKLFRKLFTKQRNTGKNMLHVNYQYGTSRRRNPRLGSISRCSSTSTGPMTSFETTI